MLLGPRGILLAVLALVTNVPAECATEEVRLILRSTVDVDLDVYWINTWKRNELVAQQDKPIPGYGQIAINSYVGHSFLVVDHEFTDGLTHYNDKAVNPVAVTSLTMTEFDMEASVIRGPAGELLVTYESALTRTKTLMDQAVVACSKSILGSHAGRTKTTSVTGTGSQVYDSTTAESGSCALEEKTETSPEFLACLTKAMASDLATKEKEADKTLRMLEVVGDRARNYTCADPKMETTNTSLRSFKWNYAGGKGWAGGSYDVKVFLEEPAAKIVLLDNFATEEECAELIKSASPHLKAATINSGGGQASVSEARKAKAGAVNPILNDPMDKPGTLYRRGYSFANEFTGYNMTLLGQEGFSVIKYGPKDEYRPHCDGDCTGTQYRPGGRVASMVVYCEAAVVGGGTTFSSSDVFINGKKGQAAFFSYLGPDGKTDKGKTRHSGCPILKGTKWIATMWMRLGITQELNWQYYDPEGAPHPHMWNMGKSMKRSKFEEGGDDSGEIDIIGSSSDAPSGEEAANAGLMGSVLGGISEKFNSFMKY